MKLMLKVLPYLTVLTLAASAPKLLATGAVVYFDTGLSPDGGFPTIEGTQTGSLTPVHDMIIDQATSRVIPNDGSSGYIASLEFFLNGTLIARGVGSGFVNGEPTPAIFNQPVFLSAGVTYGLEVDTSGYLGLFHTSQIATSDGLISNIAAIDANGTHWVAFPSLVLAGPVPEPSALVYC